MKLNAFQPQPPRITEEHRPAPRPSLVPGPREDVFERAAAPRTFIHKLAAGPSAKDIAAMEELLEKIRQGRSGIDDPVLRDRIKAQLEKRLEEGSAGARSTFRAKVLELARRPENAQRPLKEVVAEWLKSLPASERDAMIAALMHDLASSGGSRVMGDYADPAAANYQRSMLVAALASDPALFEQVAASLPPESRRQLASSIVLDHGAGMLRWAASDGERASMLAKLLDPAARPQLELFDVAEGQYAELSRLAEQDPALAKALSAQTDRTSKHLALDILFASKVPGKLEHLQRLGSTPEALVDLVFQNSAKLESLTLEEHEALAKSIAGDPRLTPAQRTKALAALLNGASKERFDALVSELIGRDRHGADQVAAVMSGDPALQARFGQLGRESQKSVATALLKLPLARGDMGQAAARMFASMSPADKNALVDALERSPKLLHGLLEGAAFADDFGPFLDGLTPANLATINRGFMELARASSDNPTVADPTKLGSSVEFETREDGSTTDGKRTTWSGEIGGTIYGVDLKGGVSRETEHSQTTSRGTTKKVAQNEGEQQEYGRKVRNWTEVNLYTRAAKAVGQHVQSRPDEDQKRFQEQLELLDRSGR